MKMEQYPWWSIAQVDFLIVQPLSVYNAILKQPSLNAFRAIVSIYYLKMKFLMAYETGEVHGNEDLAYHCYHIALQRDETINIYLVKGPNPYDELAEQWELVEDLISIPLANRNEKHTFQIRSNLDHVIKD